MQEVIKSTLRRDREESGHNPTGGMGYGKQPEWEGSQGEAYCPPAQNWGDDEWAPSTHVPPVHQPSLQGTAKSKNFSSAGSGAATWKAPENYKYQTEGKKLTDEQFDYDWD